jgi:hypothetical protein
MLRGLAALLLLLLVHAIPLRAAVVVFDEPGFPALESQAPSRATLAASLAGLDVRFAGLEALRAGDVREHPVSWPGGEARAVYSGDEIHFLDRAELPGGAGFARERIGAGEILFFRLPLELSDDTAALLVTHAGEAVARYEPVASPDPGATP